MEEIDRYFPVLLTIYAAISIAFMSPGPNFLGVVTAAIDNRMNGVFVGIGISIGSAIWAIFAVTGMSAIVSSSQAAASVIGVAGALYLGWLGIKSLRGIRSAGSLNVEAAGGVLIRPAASLSRGLTIQLTNPKSAVFWLAITSAVLAPNTPVMVLVTLVVGCFSIAIVWHILLALVFSAGPARAVYLRAKPLFSLLFGAFFLFLSIRIIISAIQPYL
jgi:threonine/homoserine/homoserine lactone efflux protein